MLTQNLHTHTVFDDGKNTPGEMAQAALEAGLTSLGFSGHSVLPIENDWSLTDERMAPYKAAVARVRERFAGKLAVYWGLEWDALSAPPAEDFDYVIGSLHHIDLGNAFPSVDHMASVSRNAINQYFGGDERAMLRAYFDQYGVIAENQRVDIVGHFDLITKFCETDGLFDANDPFLLQCAAGAMEKLVRAGKIFEVNTGAMSRGYRTQPYPSPPLLRLLCDMGGRVTVTADAHRADDVAYAFDEVETLLRKTGFQEVWIYDGTAFVPVEI